MFGKGIRGPAATRLEVETPDSWASYRQALACLDQSDWTRALVLLAEAETTFRTFDDHHGLWRALIGQALLHWREDMQSLAVARAMAALRAAETADDGFAVGCVAWQIAHMLLGQGDYARAAEFLDQAQLALDAVGMAPPGGALAAAAQLCTEIMRWQQASERQQLSRHEADAAIAEAQRALITRLHRAATAVRSAPASTIQAAGPEIIFLLPEAPALLTPLNTAAPRSGLSARLGRLWRRLISVDGSVLGEELTRTPVAVLLPLEPEQPDLGPAIEPEPRSSAPKAAEPPAALPIDDGAPATPAPVPQPEPASLAPVHRGGLAIYCFGSFRVYFNDGLIERWESARGRTIFKYLVARRTAPAPKELLADMFWPGSEPELARRSLHQAIYCLRQTFKRLAPDAQIVQFANDHYQINPELEIWVDSEAFAQAIEQARALNAAGKTEQAIQSYALAVDLYGAPFLQDDRYEGWTEEARRTYQTMYLAALHQLARYHSERGDNAAAILMCQRTLAEESCDEEAHRTLMACYMAQGLRHLAVRQFQICTNALKTELGIAPSEELEAFYRQVVAMG